MLNTRARVGGRRSALPTRQPELTPIPDVDRGIVVPIKRQAALFTFEDPRFER